MDSKKKAVDPAETFDGETAISDETIVMVTIGKRQGKLVLPPSFSLREDLAFAGIENPRRAFAAALGVCWKGSPRIHLHISDSNWNVLEYGGKVIDYLLEKGVSREQIRDAGGAAYILVRDSVIDISGVDKAESFFDSESTVESDGTG